ncbi:MAG: virulence-associated E family protein, partial [Bacteroidetes bacterium]|nr:virulence-associated E family protein [Bacteroidota bacterium]
IDDFYYNKQALVLVSTRQNSGKSTFCRFLCPPALQDYIVENIGTDKDSLVAVTENFLINLDELSTAEKNEINAFKSMFSKDKIKARQTYDKRASIHVRRASFIGSTDRWEFLTDENGSVRWLCFDITEIDWKYSKQVDINKVYAHAWHLLTKTKFDYELTPEEISENDRINKKYQVSTPERDLIQRYFTPSDSAHGIFFTATDVLEYLLQYTTIKLSPEKIGKEMKFLGFERTTKRLSESNPKYGYYLQEMNENHG